MYHPSARADAGGQAAADTEDWNHVYHVASSHFFLCEVEETVETPSLVSMPPTKVCSQCKAVVHIRRKVCESCDHVFRSKRAAEYKLPERAMKCI